MGVFFQPKISGIENAVAPSILAVLRHIENFPLFL